MKRTIVIAVLAGVVVITHGSAFAGNPGQNAGPQGPQNGAPQGPQNVAPQGQQNIAPQGQQNVAPQGARNIGPQGQNMGPQGQQNMNPQQGFNGQQFGGQQAPQGIGTHLKRMHGRFDGGAIAPPEAGGKVVGGIMLSAGKDCKPFEKSRSVGHYLVNYCRYKQCAARFNGFLPPPTFMDIDWMPAPHVPFGDLELLGVGMVADGTAEQGPVYRITMFNNSPMASRHFHVSLMAMIGDAIDSALVVTVPVKVVEANAAATVDVQLPIGVMSIGAPAQPFDSLIAVIDSLDELAETSELNNIATLSRAEVVTVTVEAAAAVVPGAEALPAPAANGVPTDLPVDGQAVAPPQGEAPAVQGNPNPAAPTADTSGLDLDAVAGAAELLNR